MALPVDLERAARHSITSTGAVPSDFYYINKTTGEQLLNVSAFMQPWTQLPSLSLHFVHYHREVSKVGFNLHSMGIDWQMFPPVLLPTALWCVGILLVRHACRGPLARFGLYMGVVTENAAAHARRRAAGRAGIWALSRRNRQKLFKFQNQLWLTAFYVASSLFGWWVQRDKPWFALPLRPVNALHMVLPHPYNPPSEIVFYYQYGFAFYVSEMLSLVFFEKNVRRIDFIEYTIHHSVTLALMFISFGGFYHRFGAYVLFIHDVSDIMLAFAKSIHYAIEEDDAREERYNKLHLETLKDGKKYPKHFIFRYILTDMTANVCFALFIIFFFYFRLYCLPSVAQATMLIRPNFIQGNWTVISLSVLLTVALQALHVYWALLIVKMVASLLLGGARKDIRSEGDEASEEPTVEIWGGAGADTTAAEDAIIKEAKDARAQLRREAAEKKEKEAQNEKEKEQKNGKNGKSRSASGSKKKQ